jgi:cobalt-zinc-cadmium efflux system membrane fusion protein
VTLGSIVTRQNLIAALAAALLSACSDPAVAPPTQQEPRVEGETIVFSAGSAQLTAISSHTAATAEVPALRLNGRLAWNEDRTVRVYTPFAGRVERILAQTGDKVVKGQTLAVVGSPELGQAQAEARRADSDYALAEKNLARVKELEQYGVAARKELQAAEAEHARAKAELERTSRRLAMYGARRETVDQTYALTSPITGTVVERNINPGQELRPDQLTANAPPLFVVTDPAALWAWIEASEKDLPKLRAGKKVALHTPAYPGVAFAATVVAVADFVDPTTRTIKVRAALDNRDRRLKADMFITAEIDADGETEVQVPAKSVFFQGEKHYVFVASEGGRFTRREVRTGDVRQNRIEILDGLREGERVVTEGTLMLQQIMQPRRVQK